MSDSRLHELTNALQPVRRAWVQAATRQLTGIDVSTSLATVILFASRLGRTSHQRALAVELGVNPAALVRLLDHGEAMGLLIRRDAIEDRRSKIIELLPEGQRLAVFIEETLSKLRRDLLGDIPEADVETAIRVLRLIEERAAGWRRDDQEH